MVIDRPGLIPNHGVLSLVQLEMKLIPGYIIRAA